MHKKAITNWMLRVTAVCCAVFLSVVAYSSSVVEVTVVGRVESLYQNRVSLRVIEVVGEDTSHLPVKAGSWISFDLPKTEGRRNRRDRRNISFGNVIEAQLVGNTITEYEVKTDGTSDQSASDKVMLWTAQNAVRVKNERDYMTEEEKAATSSDRRGRRKSETKEKEPVKIWTQEETVRGTINIHKERVYIKEDGLGRRDRGLDIITESWGEKLKDLEGQTVVVHGTTHRTSVSSGTMEVQNLMRIYQN